MPQNIFKEDLQRLFAQIQFFKPETLLIAGDMFHSHANKEIDLFLKWRNDLGEISVYLIKGNHDVLSNKFYEEANIKIVNKKFQVRNFCFTHDIANECEDEEEKLFTFSGHIHPGIKVSGIGKQSFMLPCFYFSDTYAVLPAFSHFTGLYKLRPKEKDNVFALIENKVIKM